MGKKKNKTLSKMFGLQIPSCVQRTGGVVDEKGRKGLLWQRGPVNCEF